MAINAVLVPISQGTEVMIVTEYCSFQDYTRTASKTLYGIQSNHAVLWCRTTRIKTHVGLDPGESVEYTKHRVSPEGSSVARVSSQKDTWSPYSLWTDQAKEGA